MRSEWFVPNVFAANEDVILFSLERMDHDVARCTLENLPCDCNGADLRFSARDETVATMPSTPPGNRVHVHRDVISIAFV